MLIDGEHLQRSNEVVMGGHLVYFGAQAVFSSAYLCHYPDRDQSHEGDLNPIARIIRSKFTLDVCDTYNG